MNPERFLKHSRFFWIRNQTLARTSNIQVACSAVAFDAPEENKHAQEKFDALRRRSAGSAS